MKYISIYVKYECADIFEVNSLPATNVGYSGGTVWIVIPPKKVAPRRNTQTSHNYNACTNCIMGVYSASNEGNVQKALMI